MNTPSWINSKVSIIIPCHNEEAYIGECLNSIIIDDFPKDNLEVIVVDGMSEDGTRDIIKGYSKKVSFIKRLDNPQKVTPCAFNIGIKASKGDIIMIMGSHSTYAKDYISKCVHYLNTYDADNVGGVMITLPRDKSFVGKLIVTALTHRFGVGNSTFRTGSKDPKWVDTVFGGCYKREVFEEVGLFDENLVFSQDMEFNLRLKKAGGKILLVPAIVSYYYARPDLKSFIKHNLRNGFWVTYPIKFVTHMPISWRHLVPFAFVSSLVISAVLSLFFKPFLWLLLLITVTYILANIYFSLRITFSEKRLRFFLLMPVIFAIIHFTYGLGSIWGGLHIMISKQFWENWFMVKAELKKCGTSAS